MEGKSVSKMPHSNFARHLFGTRHCATLTFAVDADFKLTQSEYKARGQDFCASDGMGMWSDEKAFRDYLEGVKEIIEAGLCCTKVLRTSNLVIRNRDAPKRHLPRRYAAPNSRALQLPRY